MNKLQFTGSWKELKGKLKQKYAQLSSGEWLAPAVLGAAAALGAAALYSNRKTHEAEHKYPPLGRFLSVDGVRLHYIERGTGEPLVLIHGNGTLIQDFTINGLVDRLSERYRVIVIERPGFGYSTRPRQPWTPRAHATLFQKALQQLGVDRAVVLGHSWGTMVAVSLALQAPALVRGLVLLRATTSRPLASTWPGTCRSPSRGSGMRCTGPSLRCWLGSRFRALSARCSSPRRCLSTSTGFFQRS